MKGDHHSSCPSEPFALKRIRGQFCYFRSTTVSKKLSRQINDSDYFPDSTYRRVLSMERPKFVLNSLNTNTTFLWHQKEGSDMVCSSTTIRETWHMPFHHVSLKRIHAWTKDILLQIRRNLPKFRPIILLGGWIDVDTVSRYTTIKVNFFAFWPPR